MPTAEIRGTTIYYEQVGDGSDLFFIHGMCGDARSWSPQIERLAGRFRCTAYDRRGHSRSPRGDEPESDAGHAADAAALIETLAIQPVVVGSSGGARVALELVRQRPDLTPGVVLSEPPLFTVAPDAGAAFMAPIFERVIPRIEASDPEGAVAEFFQLVCPGLWSAADDATRARLQANAPAMIAAFEADNPPVTVDDLAEMTTPTLLISGRESDPSLRAISSVLADQLPNVRLVELERCGHVTYFEQPDAFAAAVSAFADEVQSAGERG